MHPARLVLPAALLLLAACGDPRVPAVPAAGQTVSAAPAQPPVPVEGPPQAPRIEAAVGTDLTRADCVRIALEANRGYLQKAGGRERARLQAEIAQAELYRPSLKAAYTKTIDEPDDGNGRIAATLPVLGVQVAPYTTLSWDEDAAEYESAFGVAFSRRVFALSEHVRLRLPLSQAEVDYLAAAYDLIAAAKDLERDVTAAFLNVLNARAKVRLRETRIADASESLRIARENVEHGFKPRSDLLFAEINLNQAESDLLRDRAGERDAVERLLGLLARPLDGDLTLVAGELDAVSGLPLDVAADLARVLDHHEDLLVQDARIRLLEDRAKVARDEVAPELTATLSAERRLTGAEPFGNEIEDEDRIALRLDLDLPLDGQRVERARLLQLRRQIQDQRLARADTSARLEQQLRTAWRTWERALSEVTLATTRVDTERQRLDATQARYETGEVDNLEVVRAKQALDDAEIRLLDTRIGLANAIAAYRAILPAVTSAEVP